MMISVCVEQKKQRYMFFSVSAMDGKEMMDDDMGCAG